jgi:hypothetical protein
MFRSIALALLGLSAAVAQDGWISLFNGKDFTGWKVSEHPASFTIRDGAIAAHGERAHCFYVGEAGQHNFKNFELKVDVKADANSNGGIFIHTEYQDTGWPAKGFEIQVNNTYNKDPVKTGSLYHEKDVHEALPKDNERFTEHIGVRGNKVTIAVNGKQTVSWNQPADWNGTSDFVGRRISSGTIALQGHDPGSTVYYKNIQIKPLP